MREDVLRKHDRKYGNSSDISGPSLTRDEFNYVTKLINDKNENIYSKSEYLAWNFGIPQ
jgi:hypothetical protein